VEIRVLRAVAKYMAGDWDGSEASAEPPGRRVSDTVLARLAAVSAFPMVGRGRFDEAEKLFAELRPHWHRETEIAIFNGYAETELALWRNRPEHAASVVREVTQWLHKSGWEWAFGQLRLSAWGVAAQVELARKARRERNADAELAAVGEGERLADAATEIAEGGRPWTGFLGPEGAAWLAMVQAERSRLTCGGDPDLWRRAVDAFAFGSVYDQALARLRLAEALLAVDDRAGATEALAAVTETTTALGARPMATAVADLARRGRLTVPGLAPPRDQVDPFTPRERAVLALVAEGRTNRQVGQELYISEKTVSVHLSRIMAKLGASRRAEAVAAAYERGLLEPTGGD
jgi:DNA-binding CsgD family transcriptional regulator